MRTRIPSRTIYCTTVWSQVVLVIVVLQHGVVASKSSCTEEDVSFYSQEGVCGCALRCPFSYLEKAMTRGAKPVQTLDRFPPPERGLSTWLSIQLTTQILI